MASRVRKTGLRALAAAATMWVLLVVARAGEVAESAAGGRGEDTGLAQASIGNAVAGYMLSNRHILSVGEAAGSAGAVQAGGRALLSTQDAYDYLKKDKKEKKDKKDKEDDKEKRRKSIAEKKAALEELKKKSPPGRRYFKKIRSKWFPRGPRGYPKAPAPSYKVPKPAKSPPPPSPPPPHKAPPPPYKAPKPAAKSPPPHKSPAPSYKSPKPAAKSSPPPPPHKTPAPSYKQKSPPPPTYKPPSPLGLSRYRTYRRTTPTPSPPPVTTTTPSPPPATSAPSPTSTQKAWLDPHNAARAKKSLPALTWDTTLEKYALDWANHQKTTGNCALVHSHGPYGENLFWGYGKTWTPADAVAGWVDEEKYYNYATNSCASGQMCGHYTQVMWKTSLRLGCAQVTCNDGALFFICSYDPPGNYIGQKPY